MNLRNILRILDSQDLNLFDRQGRPTWFVDSKSIIFSFEGIPLGYLKQEAVYTFDGYHVGWVVKGWLTDKQGRFVLSSPISKDGPIRPVSKWVPAKKIKLNPPPVLQARVVRPIKPVFTNQWSPLSTEDFFKQR